MRKLYEKNELIFSLIWIGAYIVLLSAAENLSDVLAKNTAAAALCAAMTVFLFLWLGKTACESASGSAVRPAARGGIFTISLLRSSRR
mgnify:CR=1 FL=1